MKGCRALLLFILATLLLPTMPQFAGPVSAGEGIVGVPDDWELHEITVDDNGFLHRTAGDPYIVFPELTEPLCGQSAVRFTIRITPMPEKPIYLELFWRPPSEGFGEIRKMFFIVKPAQGRDTVSFSVALDNQAGFRQLRLDLPPDLNAPFRIERYALVPLADLPEDANLVDTYSALTASETGEAVVIIPYLIKTVRHGLTRLSRDPAFLLVWLLMFAGLLVLHRILIRTDRR